MRLAAVDLGATSGRVMVGTVDEGRLELDEVHRFDNAATEVEGHLRWDVEMIRDEVVAGLAAAGPVDGIGVDSWAVDYALLDDQGRLLGHPVSHRDSRTAGVLDRVVEQVPARELYDVTGLQQLPFNTVYQLVSELPLPATTETLLMIPDLLGFWLTGQRGAEATNASTTQLYDVRGRAWATGLAEQLGIPAGILPPLREPGELVGGLTREMADRTGLPPDTPVIAVGSHDTASAVVGVPFEDPRAAAYVSSGTWSLVGVELDAPVLSDAAREASFTNEGGVDGTIRFLHNVTGLWLLSESLRVWSDAGETCDLTALLDAAARMPGLRTVVDVDHPSFLPPGDMPARIEQRCRETDQPPPASPEEHTRCVLDSLALAYRRTVRRAAELSGHPVDVVHVVGGGARNELLCQLTADACGVPVLAGPVEATALGNVLVQARSLGADLLDLAAMRRLVRKTQQLVRYEPTGDPHRWDEAAARLW